MTTIQFLEADEDIYNKISFLTDAKFKLIDRGNGPMAIFVNPTELTRETIIAVSKTDSDTKINNIYSLESIVKRLELLELKTKALQIR